MKICTYCGSANDDSSSICSSCGAMLPQDLSQGKKSNVPKKLLAILGVVLCVAIISVGVSLLLKGNSAKVANAGSRTVSEIIAKLEEDTEIKQLIGQVQTLSSKGRYTLGISYRSQDVDLMLMNHYSRGSKQMQGSLEFAEASYNMHLNIKFSADKKAILFTPSESAMNVYGFKMKDFSQKYRSSFLYSIFPIDIPENLDKLLFSKNTIDNILKNSSSGSIKTLMKSIEVETVDTRQLNIGGTMQKCRVYHVSWSKQMLDELLKSNGSETWIGSAKDLVKKILPKIDPDCTIYINSSGYIVGIDFVSAGVQYQLLMEGSENIWDTFTLKKNSIYSEPEVYTGNAVCDANGVRITLDNGSCILFEFSYNKATKEYILSTEEAGTLVRGNVQVSGDVVGMTFVWDVSEYGSQEIAWNIAPLAQAPSQLSKNYIDLFDMDLTDWQRLLFDLRNH